MLLLFCHHPILPYTNINNLNIYSKMSYRSIISIISFVIRITSLVQADHDHLNITLPDKPPVKVNLTTGSSWIEQSVQRHNHFRHLHNVQPIKLNKTLSEMSQSWSNYLLKRGLASIRRTGLVEFFDHSYEFMREHNLGQNLYYIGANYDKLSPGLAPQIWYNEISEYNYKTGGGKRNDSLYGHFSQMIWNSSNQMGTAYASAKLPNSTLVLTFVTTYYYPRGNMFVDGDNSTQLFLENVIPPAANISSEEKCISKIIAKNGIKLSSNVTTPDGWIAAATAKHNDYRTQFKVAEIFISDELCHTATARAEELLANALKEFDKSGMIVYNKTTNNVFKESVMYFLTYSNDIIEACIPIVLWFDEKRLAKNGKITNVKKTEHFDLIVSKDVTHMCMVLAGGVAENGQYLTFTVAQYYSGALSKQVKNVSGIAPDC